MSSYFPIDSFNQRVLDEIEDAQAAKGLCTLDVIRELLEVLKYLACKVPSEINGGTNDALDAARNVYRNWSLGNVSATDMKLLGKALRLESDA